MKQHFLFTAGALALMSLAACSNDETIREDLNKTDAISYQVVTNNSTRTTSLYNAGDNPAEFKVTALKAGATNVYFEGDLVKLVDGEYVADNSRYWPDYALDFYAYTQPSAAAATVAYNTTDKALKFTNVELAENGKDQDDMLYAATKNQAKSANGKVTLNFRHAFAQLAFKFKNESKGLHVDVQGVQLVNIATKGNAVVKDATDGQFTTDGTNPYSSQIAWTLLNPAKAGSATANHPKSFLELSGNSFIPVAYGTDAVPFTFNADAKDDVMFVLPQDMNPLNLTTAQSAESLKDMYFLIKCRIFNVANSTAVNYATDTPLYGDKNTFKTILIPVSLATDAPETAFKAGKKYIYTFIFGRKGGNGGLDPENPDPNDPILNTITYTTETITVDDWSIVTPEYEVEMTTKK